MEWWIGVIRAEMTSVRRCGVVMIYRKSDNKARAGALFSVRNVRENDIRTYCKCRVKKVDK